MTIDYSLYLVADTNLCETEKLVNLVAQLSEYGLTCVQLRMKNQPKDDVIRVGEKLLNILREKKIPLIINDHIEIAKQIDADGVHIGQGDKPWQQARDHLGPGKIIGLSIENYKQAEQCRDHDVDYFGIGPIYPTDTKPDAAAPLGITQLKNIVQLLAAKPTVAIGGLHENNIDTVLSTGVSGIAFASTIMLALSPCNSLKKLSQVVHLYRGLNAN